MLHAQGRGRRPRRSAEEILDSQRSNLLSLQKMPMESGFLPAYCLVSMSAYHRCTTSSRAQLEHSARACGGPNGLCKKFGLTAAKVDRERPNPARIERIGQSDSQPDDG